MVQESEKGVTELRGNRRDLFRFGKGIAIGVASAVIGGEAASAAGEQTPSDNSDNSTASDTHYVVFGASLGTAVGIIAGDEVFNAVTGRTIGSWGGAALGMPTGVIVGGLVGLGLKRMTDAENS